MFLIKFSIKNLKRHPKRMFFITLAIILTTMFVIWLLSLAESSTYQITNQITGAFSGRYTLSNPKFHDASDPRKMNFYKTINLSKIDKKKITKLAKRVLFPVFVSGERKTSGSLLVGIEFNKEKNLNSFSKSIIKGEYLKSDNKKEIILGNLLAQKLKIQIGDKIAIIGQGLKGSIANDLFIVKGIFSFGGAEIEENLVITDLRSAQIFGEMTRNQVHNLVGFRDYKAGKISNLKKLTWEEMLVDVALTMNFTKEMTRFLTNLFIMIVCIGLSNTILLSFFERRKEFGTLKTIGANSSWIVGSMVYEVLIMSFIGVFVGNYLGYFLIEYFYFNPINLKLFSGGQDLLLGHIVLDPKIKLLHDNDFHIKASLTILLFISLSMIYPIIYTLKRSDDAI